MGVRVGNKHIFFFFLVEVSTRERERDFSLCSENSLHSKKARVHRDLLGPGHQAKVIGGVFPTTNPYSDFCQAWIPQEERQLRLHINTHSVRFIHSVFNNVLVFGGILKIIRGILTSQGKEGIPHSFIHSV